MASVIFQNEVAVPLDIGGLADFRRWLASPGFPERGRIDYVAGSIEVDMSPEQFFSHGTLKAKICAALLAFVEERDLGYVVTDSTRVTCVEANLSAEPDVVFVSKESLRDGRVRLLPGLEGGDDVIEVEGAPDLIVEVVSDASVVKDTRRLPVAYYRAGVREYWLVDGRGEPLSFTLFRRAGERYEPAEPNQEDFRRSDVLDGSLRLLRRRDELGHWVYQLEIAS